jgi:hypothetical protein
MCCRSRPWTLRAELLYVLVAAIWLLPDRRIERAVAGRKTRLQGEPSAARTPGEDSEAADERRAA